ncbi:MAG: hypothetical protein J5793_04565 [Clostridia bacterium]|nr:hypothetical protein [Clostridia bacterium]
MANETRTKSFKSAKKYGKIFWGIVLILSAVALILNGVGIEFGYGITAWRIILGIVLVAWLVYEIVRLKFTNLFFPLAFLFIVFQGPIANACGMQGDKIIDVWIVLVAALLLTVGFKIMFRRKKVINVNGTNVNVGKNSTVGGKIGNETLYLDASDLSEVVVSEHLGSVEIFISNREAYDGNGQITICENLGKITVHIPGEWNVVTHSSENLGQVSIPQHDATGDKSITLIITENLGQVVVVFD